MITHPLRVGVDGYPVSGARTGVGRYTAEVLKALATRADVDVTVALATHRRGNLSVDDLVAAGIRIVRPRPIVSRGLRAVASTPLALPFDLAVGRQDHMLYPNYRWYPARGATTCTVVYDLGFLHVPETQDPRYAARLPHTVEIAMRKSDVIVTISQAVADEIGEAYPWRDGPVVVAPPGADPSFATMPQDTDRRLEALGLTRGYLLHVGTLEPRKNLGMLVDAVSVIPGRLVREHPLVLAGAEGWAVGDLQDAISRAGDRVRWLPDVDEPTLRALYAGASVLVFPSRYEGFGMPVLEAMAMGLPVLCSDLPVLREVGGDVASYVASAEPDVWAAAIEDHLVGGGPGSSVLEEGRRRAADHTWERTAETIALASLEVHGRRGGRRSGS